MGNTVSKGVTIWLTGLPSSGKSTIARHLEKNLKKQSLKVELLDGDVVRMNLSKGLGFSKEDRDINIKRIGFVAELLTRNGVICVVSAVSPYRATRDFNRERISDFVEVYVETSLEECEARDVKGLYKKARQGEIPHFTGIDDPYEEPLQAEVICKTAEESVDESTEKILTKLAELGYLQTNRNQTA